MPTKGIYGKTAGLAPRGASGLKFGDLAAHLGVVNVSPREGRVD